MYKHLVILFCLLSSIEAARCSKGDTETIFVGINDQDISSYLPCLETLVEIKVFGLPNYLSQYCDRLVNLERIIFADNDYGNYWLCRGCKEYGSRKAKNFCAFDNKNNKINYVKIVPFEANSIGTLKFGFFSNSIADVVTLDVIKSSFSIKGNLFGSASLVNVNLEETFIDPQFGKRDEVHLTITNEYIDRFDPLAFVGVNELNIYLHNVNISEFNIDALNFGTEIKQFTTDYCPSACSSYIIPECSNLTICNNTIYKCEPGEKYAKVDNYVIKDSFTECSNTMTEVILTVGNSLSNHDIFDYLINLEKLTIISLYRYSYRYDFGLFHKQNKLNNVTMNYINNVDFNIPVFKMSSAKNVSLSIHDGIIGMLDESSFNIIAENIQLTLNDVRIDNYARTLFHNAQSIEFSMIDVRGIYTFKPRMFAKASNVKLYLDDSELVSIPNDAFDLNKDIDCTTKDLDDLLCGITDCNLKVLTCGPGAELHYISEQLSNINIVTDNDLSEQVFANTKTMNRIETNINSKINNEIVRINNKVNSTDNELNRINAKFNNVNNKVNSTNNELNRINAKFNNINNELTNINKKLMETNDIVNDNTRRLKNSTVNDKLDELSEQIDIENGTLASVREQVLQLSKLDGKPSIVSTVLSVLSISAIVVLAIVLLVHKKRYKRLRVVLNENEI